MKAAIYTKFGPPEVLKIQEIDDLVVKENEVLIRVFATTVEKEDPDFRRKPGFNGLFKPKKPILGMFFAGKIEAIGEKVSNWQIGDEVFGSTGLKMGTTAEYITLDAHATFVNKPSSISYIEAVSVLNGALTALPFLRETSHISSNMKVLINGASGSVGTAAIQLAKYLMPKLWVYVALAI